MMREKWFSESDLFVPVPFASKTGLVTTAWDRLFFFTQGGNLMCQPRGAVAGGMVLDLDNSSVMAIDCEDRRYCFQITSPSGKTCARISAGEAASDLPGGVLMSPPSVQVHDPAGREQEGVRRSKFQNFSSSFTRAGSRTCESRGAVGNDLRGCHFWTRAWKHLSQPVSARPSARVGASGSPNVHSLLFYSGFALSTTSPDRST